MDSILADAYQTVLPAAPYVIAAYALMLLVLLAYIIFVVVSFKRSEAQLKAIEDSLEDGKEGR
jgi:hypothetical protein